MDWDEGSVSEDGSLDGGDSGSEAGAEAAAALGMDTQPPEFYDPQADDKDEKWVVKMRRERRSDALLSCPLCFTTLCIDCQQHERFENQFRALFVMNCRVKTNQVVAVPEPPGSKRKQRQRERKQQRQQEEEQARRQAAGEQQDVPAGQQQQEQQQEQVQPPAGEQPPAAQQPEQQPAEQAQQQQRGPGGAPPARHDGPFNPVCCDACGTEVGLRDASDGVYHLFNVFASNS